MSEFYADKRAKDQLRSRCKVCVIADTKAYGQAHPAMKWASNRKWRERNPAKVAATKRRYALKKYGLTPEDYDAMLERQSGRCAICASPDPHSRWGRFHIDHDHETGRVRGLLCHPCNLHLGLVEARLPQMASYLGLVA